MLLCRTIYLSLNKISDYIESFSKMSDSDNCISQSLVNAIAKGNVDQVKEFLNDNTNINVCSLLIVAVKNQRYDVVKLLLAYGCDINLKDDIGKSAIYYSVEQKDLEISRLLLQRGANVSISNELLRTAARRESVCIVKLLLEFGADVNTSDRYGQTPLHYSVLQDSSVFTFKIRSRTKDLNSIEAIVRMLLDKGADVNAVTINGFSTLHYAVNSNSSNIVSTLLEYGADIDMLIDNLIETPRLYEFCQRVNCPKPIFSSHDSSLTTILHIATENNYEGVLKMLLNKGAKVDAVQYDGKTPLIIAVEKDHWNIVEILLKYNADTECRNKQGMTPLHLACLRGSVLIVDLLLKSGADINARCNRGKVPYQYALMFKVNCTGSFNRVQAAHERNAIILMEILQRYINLMYLNNLNLDEINMISELPRISQCAKITQKLTNFKRSLKVYNTVRLSDIIKENVDPVYVNNPKVIEELERIIGVLNEKCPVLIPILKYVVKKAKLRFQLLNRGQKWFMFINEKSRNRLPKIPGEIVRQILYFLNEDEIKTVIKLGEDINNKTVNNKKKVNFISLSVNS